MFRTQRRAPVENTDTNTKYAVTIDSGSSGSRLEIYSWLDHEVALSAANETQKASLPVIQINGKQKKVHPGISTFADSPGTVGEEHLEPLLKYALKQIPPQHQSSTPLFLLATAGMRLLSPEQQNEILASACAYARKRTPFLLPDCDSHFQVIDGTTEGLYGWISINYLLASFDRPELHNHGKGHSSYGFIDMGGASAQVAFAPNQTETERHAEDLMLLRLRSLDGVEKEYRVFVSTWLGYGANEARRRYVQDLQKLSHSADGLVRDPCLPRGLELPIDNTELKLLGSGSLSECLNQQSPLLAKDMDCHDDPCLFGGVHAPAIDFDVNHFIGVSEYWHTTNDVFDMGGAYDYSTYSKKVEEFCSRDWDSIVKDLKRQKWGKKLDEDKLRMVCFKASWMMNVLHDGFGVPRLTREFENPPSSSHNTTQDLADSAKSHGFLDPFTSVDRIGGVEVSWTLGKVVLYSSSTVNSLNVPAGKEIDDADAMYMVGFGPNNNRLYSEGEFYTTSGLVVPMASTGALARLSGSFAMGRRIPGLILLLTMICVAVWLVMGKERRTRILGSTTRKWFKKKRRVMGASGVYERLEAGEGEDEEFDDGIGGRAWALQELKPPRPPSSGHAGSSPRFDMSHIGVAATSSFGRSESRERLSRPGSRSEYRGKRS